MSGLLNYFFNKTTIPAPPKYKTSSALAIKICVMGSVEGVIIAAKIVDITTTYFHNESIFLPEIIPKNPKTNCKTGI